MIVASSHVAVAWGARSSNSAGHEQVLRRPGRRHALVDRRLALRRRPREAVWKLAGPEPPAGTLVRAGPAARFSRKPALDSGGHGHGRRLLRHRRLDADGRPLADRADHPARRRAPALRLRRGHAAADAALELGLVDLHEVFLTHYHADHYLGLPGMLKTFALRGREVPITIYGPPGLAELFASLRRIFGKLTYPYELVELHPGRRARARRLPPRHLPGRARRLVGRLRARRGRPARAVRRRDRRRARRPVGPERGALQRGEAMTLADGTRRHARRRCSGEPRPGRTVVIAGDTAPARAVLEAARGADLLVHEATFLEDERERARETAHSTAVDAAELARAPASRCSR